MCHSTTPSNANLKYSMWVVRILETCVINKSLIALSSSTHGRARLELGMINYVVHCLGIIFSGLQFSFHLVGVAMYTSITTGDL